jgi:hypothetical protein
VFVTEEQATISNTMIIGVETSQRRDATPWGIGIVYIATLVMMATPGKPTGGASAPQRLDAPG